MSKKLALVGLALAGLFVVGTVMGKDAKASSATKVFRFNCVTSAFAFPPADGNFYTVAGVTVTNRRAGGIVHVSASGMSVMSPGDYLTLSLSTAPASRGPWVNSFGPTGSYYNWTVQQCFYGSAAVANTFYLNVADFSGVGGSDVEMCAMSATAMQNPLTELCEFGGFAEQPTFGTGPTNR
jgi:hypothetical protein